MQQIKVLLVASVLLGLCLHFVEAGLRLEAKTLPPANSTGGVQLPRLFDFAHYKNVYNKKYSSLREELVRTKLYLARAFRSFISGIAYKHRQITFYLSINRRSDWTPNEILNSLPKIRPLPELDVSGRKVKQDRSQIKLPRPTLIDASDLAKEFSLIETETKHRGDKALDTILSELHELKSREAGKNRKRRTSRAEAGTKLRKFSLDKLFKDPRRRSKTRKDDIIVSSSSSIGDSERAGERLSHKDIIAKIESRRSQTEQDVFVDASEEFESQDEEDEDIFYDAEEMPFELVRPQSSYLHSLIDWIRNKFSAAESIEGARRRLEANAVLEDKVFINHGDKCMPEAKDQANCGSCYAFSIISFYEWLLCKRTGKLTRLSEQYIVDCGMETEFRLDLDGCSGGEIERAAKFVAKYGLELGWNYPYTAREGTCPYENIQQHNNKSGYLRLNDNLAIDTIVPYKEFGEQLKVSPLVISIGTYGSFGEYGGGVHRDKKCCRTFSLVSCGAHAVVLVGHGREDGEEYWIMRNSHSADFGEEGYYRMSKDSDCIWPKYGMVYSLEKYDKKQTRFNVHKNKYRASDIQERIDDLSRYEVGNRRNFKWRVRNYALDLLY